jgi:hypothetical protein
MSMINTDDYKLQVTLVDPSRKIEVYRNLHKKCWSVRQAGLVRFHCSKVNLKDCQMVVQPAGRKKVVREQKKNVHAFVRGYLCGEERVIQQFCWDDIYYNPYESGTFVDFQGQSVLTADFVDLDMSDKKTPVLALNPT